MRQALGEYQVGRQAFRAAALFALMMLSSGVALAETPEEKRAAASRQTLAPGLQYARMEREPDLALPVWFISLGVARSDKERLAAKACARGLALPVRSQEFRWPGDDGKPYHEILAGQFASRKAAEAHMASYPFPPECQAGITASRQHARSGYGPQRVHVVILDPGMFRGMLKVAQGRGIVAGRTPTSQIASENEAIVAINGGFFAMTSDEGIVGEPTSITIIDGQIESEPTRGRPWFAIDNQNAIRAALELSSDEVAPSLKLTDGTTIGLDGVNRRPEILRNCGALLDRSALISWHDQTCILQDQMVALTASAGFLPPYFQNALYALIRADGAITESYTAPQGQELLVVATGKRVAELRRLIDAGTRAKLHVPLLAQRSRVFAIGGGPTLLKDGRKYRAEPTEGWPFALATSDQANAMHRWVNLKNPRTAIGVRRDGTILLVVVDGQRHERSLPDGTVLDGGATIEELRDVMLALGATDAMNLDGGGSSTMVIDGKVINTPSDLSGERPVGDAVVVVRSPE